MPVFSQTDNEKLTFGSFQTYLDGCLYILEARTRSPAPSTRNGLCSTAGIGAVVFHEMLQHTGETSTEEQTQKGLQR